MDEYVEIRWNRVVTKLKNSNPELMTDSKDKVYAKPVTCLRSSGRRDGVGVAFMEFVYGHVRDFC